jgi:hypothetical protein
MLATSGSVAQLDRALASGARGRAFESRRAHSRERSPVVTYGERGFQYLFTACWVVTILGSSLSFRITCSGSEESEADMVACIIRSCPSTS